MTETGNFAGVYFIGIGGIGMSALARYFISRGMIVAGYDRTKSPLTTELENEGCMVSYVDDESEIPPLFTNTGLRNRILVVYTPAIPSDSAILNYFRREDFQLNKRSEVLGEISRTTSTIAVAGTHGKTTVSTLTAHILTSSGKGCSAFLGGISKNYNSNLLLSDSEYTVIEADEYDRSFHRLSPLLAVITSADADHLDIYGDYESMLEGYSEFCRKIKQGGKLLLNEKVVGKISVPQGLETFVYGFSENCDFSIISHGRAGENLQFSIKTGDVMLNNLVYPFPGTMNMENACAASALSLMCGVDEEAVRKSLASFAGVRRRFDIRINRPGCVFIDDYAHHPEEIRAFISSVRDYTGTRKVTAIFQPHLYSRTRDHADGFAAILDTLDEVIILPVYPAREKPLEGVSSEMIVNRMKMKNCRVVEMKDILSSLDFRNIDVLLTIGAGDIDRLVEPIENKLNSLTDK